MAQTPHHMTDEEQAAWNEKMDELSALLPYRQMGFILTPEMIAEEKKDLIRLQSLIKSMLESEYCE